jgi:hypothetical protein
MYPYAGMGFDLSDSGGKQIYDASAYSGVVFWGKANAAGLPVQFKIQIPSLSGTANGGTCTGASGQCEDHFSAMEMFGTAWTQYTVPFSTLAQGGWGQAGTFTANQITDIQWQVNSSALMWDLAIDDISFM